ncbi:hypothetical protein GCM10009579_25950 [Streptomyces javensis]|uniref:Uncharacterized protein n=1 Tax=Streptomyces javensis TaxID=114698 RepID=A0ABN1WV84_9ACTN
MSIPAAPAGPVAARAASGVPTALAPTIFQKLRLLNIRTHPPQCEPLPGPGIHHGARGCPAHAVRHLPER